MMSGRSEYKLDGTVTGAAAELSFVAPAMVGAMLDRRDRRRAAPAPRLGCLGLGELVRG